MKADESIDTIFFYGKPANTQEITKRLRELGISYRLYRLPNNSQHGICIHRANNLNCMEKAEQLAREDTWLKSISIDLVLNPANIA